MPDTQTPPPADLSSPSPPPPDTSTPKPPSLGDVKNPGQVDQSTLPDLGTGKEQRPIRPAADTYIFGNKKHYDLAMSEIDDLREGLVVAREFASFVMTKDRTWPETEEVIRHVHEECHWHMEHDHGIII